jgi:ParB family chromosome partitioning protein
VGEILSGLLLADLGIAHRPRPDHAAYVASWLEALKDPRAIFTAAGKAQQAADWMHAQQPKPSAASPMTGRPSEEAGEGGGFRDGSMRPGERLPAGPSRRPSPMAKAQPRITLSVSRDIPFNRLVLSQSNVRRIKAGVAIEELAEDIARRTLLQSLTVRPVLDESGAETGMYEVPAGGRRYRALELLVKQKRLARTAPIPCVVRTGGIAEEDSLAENVQRVPLPSINFAPSSHCARRGSPRRRSPPRSSSRSPSCASACGWRPSLRSCWRSMPRTA